MLARVEVVRAVAGGGSEAIALARRQLRRFDQVDVDRRLLDDAATVIPGSRVRSLDAIHLASALTVGAELREIVTYDERMREAAEAIGLSVVAPAPGP